MDLKKDLDKMRILVVDDEPDNLSLVSVVLQYNGAVVAEAASGQACLDLLDTFHPTLVLLDISMPRMDGWEVFKRIRARPELNEVPVVALTANVLPADAAKVRAAGFNGYITKPFRVTALVDELNKAITVFKTTTQEAAAIKAAQTSPVAQAPVVSAASAPVEESPAASTIGVKSGNGASPDIPLAAAPPTLPPAQDASASPPDAANGKPVLTRQEGQQPPTPIVQVAKATDTPAKP